MEVVLHLAVMSFVPVFQVSRVLRLEADNPNNLIQKWHSLMRGQQGLMGNQAIQP